MVRRLLPNSNRRRAAWILIIICLVVAWIFRIEIIFLVWDILPVYVPARPATVPASAVWAGGKDGGAWMECVAAHPEDSCFDCRVYSDRSGMLLDSGRYCSFGLDSLSLTERKVLLPVSLDSIREMFDGFDGDILLYAPGHYRERIVLERSQFLHDISEIYTPRRPVAVPITAVWAGDQDGGAWIECVTVHPEDSCYDCVVYDSQSGALLDSGRFCPFKLDAISGAPTKIQLQVSLDSMKSLYGGFIGNSIILDDPSLNYKTIVLKRARR